MSTMIERILELQGSAKEVRRQVEQRRAAFPGGGRLITAGIKATGDGDWRAWLKAQNVPVPRKKKKRLYMLDPTTQALTALSDRCRVESPELYVSGFKKAFEKGGDGIDASYREELARIQKWIETLLKLTKPFVVSCAKNACEKGN